MGDGDADAIGQSLVAALLGRAAANVAAADDLGATPAEVAALAGGVSRQVLMLGGVGGMRGMVGGATDAEAAATALLAELGEADNPDRFRAAPLEVSRS